MPPRNRNPCRRTILTGHIQFSWGNPLRRAKFSPGIRVDKKVVNARIKTDSHPLFKTGKSIFIKLSGRLEFVFRRQTKGGVQRFQADPLQINMCITELSVLFVALQHSLDASVVGCHAKGSYPCESVSIRGGNHINPSCSFAASVIMPWFHGGSQTSSTLASSIGSSEMSLFCTSCASTGPMPQPGAVSVIFTSAL